MPFPLAVVFFLSGCASLLFETLWFRQAGLLLGNSVWTSSAVLGSFMAGLAVGNGLAVRYGRRLVRPVVVYAWTGFVVGLAGFGLVVLFPALERQLGPFLGSLTESAGLLNGARFLIAFLLMLVPATAMGATLPVLVSALTRDDAHFGRVLGLLYGSNTLGAVAGALLGEVVLISACGVRGTAVVAMGLDLLVALVALKAYGHLRPLAPAPEAATPPLPGIPALTLLSATALAGATLLALEVVWFRFLSLWTPGSSLAFAVVLAVVLLGIAVGALLTAGLLRVSASGPRWAPVVAALACLTTTLGYVLFPQVVGAGKVVTSPGAIAARAIPLMLPTAILSGVLFTLLGAGLKRHGAEHAETAGWITLANTLGALCGAAAGGLLLLPQLGMEASIFSLSALYLLIAMLTGIAYHRRTAERGDWLALGGTLALATLVLALFPFGLMREKFIPLAAGRWVRPGSATTSRLAAVREDLTETVMYVETSMWDQPISYRLITNSDSMSATDLVVARYMRLFVWLPLAINPSAQDALLISFGVGSTAKALTDTRSLRSIDVVDVSRDVLELGRIPFASGTYPLDDPRVQVHVEDGRFFLLSTRKHYDLITAEPPPPKNAGIGNLYSKEYFALIHERLNSGGLATYWLPVYQLAPTESRAIARAFCDVFADCTLWSGTGPEWILLGSKDGVRRASEEAFTRQWFDPAVRPHLREVGLEAPEQLGPTFVADTTDLRAWIGATPPLDDDHPYRLSPTYQLLQLAHYRALARSSDLKQRFVRSAFVRSAWPEALRTRTLESWDAEEANQRELWQGFGLSIPETPLLYSILSTTSVRAQALWAMSSDVTIERALERADAQAANDPTMLRLKAASALADRDYDRAERLLEQTGAADPNQREFALRIRVVALLLGKQRERAVALLQDRTAWPPVRERDEWTWLLKTFDLPDPLGLVGTATASGQ